MGLPSYQLVHLRSLPFNYSYRLELLVVVVDVASFRNLGVEIYALGSVCREIRLAHTLRDIRSKRTGPECDGLGRCAAVVA